MPKRPVYLKPVTDKKVIERMEKALSDTSKRDEALRKYRQTRSYFSADEIVQKADEVTMDWDKLSRSKIKQAKGLQRKLWMIFLSDLRDRHTLMFKNGKPKRMRKAV